MPYWPFFLPIGQSVSVSTRVRAGRKGKEKEVSFTTGGWSGLCANQPHIYTQKHTACGTVSSAVDACRQSDHSLLLEKL